MSNTATAKTLAQRLYNLADNLWWTWNNPAVALLTSIDPQLFAATNQNPLLMFRLLGSKRIAALGDDPDFLHRLQAVEKNLSAYLAAPTWYRKFAGKNGRKLKVAYFCA